MEYQSILPYLLYEFKSEHDLTQAIQELSLKFTENRDKIGDYLKDPRLVSAYTAFYLTTNAPKLASVFSWMPEEWKNLLKSSVLIDLGAGPGTFSLAFRSWLNKPAEEIIQIEKSSIMREQALKIWQGLYPGEKLSQRFESKEVRSKFLLFGHSANEMGAEEAVDYIEKINPDHILFIEPGTKDFFPVMLEIREYLLAKKFNIIFPCPEPVACPMAGTGDWCHQFIHIKHSAELERLSQIVRKDRKLLPLTVQAFSKTFKNENGGERLVRVLPETKFSFEWEVCVGEKVQQYQIMKRPFNKQKLKDLESILSGASLETKLEKELEKSKRVSLVKLNNRPV